MRILVADCRGFEQLRFALRLPKVGDLIAAHERVFGGRGPSAIGNGITP